MGQQNSYEFANDSPLLLLQQLPIGKVYKESHSETLYFIKEYAYTSEEAFQQAFLKFSSKLTTKNDNVLNLQKTNTKVDNTFCSTFYKIILVFQYVSYSLADQILVRNKENRSFEQKEIWSVLFHCTLGISHLKRTEGVEHSAIGLKDIKLCEDGTIKIIATEMVGIYSQHDQNYGTTKKLAMTILSCILTKQVSNQSTEYLEALIEKTKCSKELKKVLYFMIMDDTTFQQLQQYLFKMANDENDTIISGMSTPAYSAQKRNSIQQCSTKKREDPEKNNFNISPMKTQKQDIPTTLPQFEIFQIQNPDQKDEKENKDQSQSNISYQQTSIHPNNQTQTFSSEGNIQIDYKIKQKDYPLSTDNHEDQTVRLVSKGRSSIPSFSHFAEPIVRNTEGLYTDPKLLDLIKKDLEEIQQKSRVSIAKVSTELPKNTKDLPQTQYQKSQQQSFSTFKHSNIYTISTNDFNIKPVKVQPQKSIQSKEIFRAQNLEQKQFEKKNEQLPLTKFNVPLKEIDNNSKRVKEQESFGNILDDDASFKKQKSKKSVTVTARQSESSRDIQKQNNYESSETKRHGNNPQKNQKFNQGPKITQTKSTPQSLQQQSSNMQFVSQTYQKGEYKGYKLNGLRHGNGTFYYKEGGKYIGEWKQNKMNGKGILYYPNDEVAYDGNWKDDQLHGFGTLYNQQVVVLDKSFDYQDWSVVEEYWIKYEGQFFMDNKQGKGKFFLSNGEIFEGNFKDDMIDGEGILCRLNGSRIKGLWRKNKLLRMC